MSKKTILLDFDGVIHSYLSGWQGMDVIPDAPNTGAFKWITEAAKRYEVAVYSSRSKTPEGRMAMINWFKDHGFDTDVLQQIDFPETKPAAWITIDDRCLCFTGDWPSFEWIDDFLPWYRQPWATEGGLGATGQSPDGGDDQGELRMAVASDNGQVILDFGKPTAWVGFPPEQAKQLAAAIVKHAEAMQADD